MHDTVVRLVHCGIDLGEVVLSTKFLLRFGLSSAISFTLMAPVLAVPSFSMEQRIAAEQTAFNELEDANFDASIFRPVLSPPPFCPLPIKQ